MARPLLDAPRCDACGYLLARCSCHPATMAARRPARPGVTVIPAPRRPGRVPTEPCGTSAGARRHYRKGEKPCEPCLEANRREKNERLGYSSGTQSISRRPARNGLPETPGYQYRAHRYPWAERIIAAAEAEHGPPRPVCLCGAPVTIRDGRVVRCGACGRAPRDAAELVSA